MGKSVVISNVFFALFISIFFVGMAEAGSTNVKWNAQSTASSFTKIQIVDSTFDPAVACVPGNEKGFIKMDSGNNIFTCSSDGKWKHAGIWASNAIGAYLKDTALNVGIGTTTPRAALEVSMPLALSNKPFAIFGTGTTTTDSPRAFVVGRDNLIDVQDSIILGGQNNKIIDFASYASILSGGNNTINTNGVFGTILGGTSNLVSGTGAVVAAGSSNTAFGTYSAVLGGQSNVTSGMNAAALGGQSNVVSNNNTASLGGESNVVSGLNATILGSKSSTASGDYATVVGGQSNTASGMRSLSLGGQGNTVTGIDGVVFGNDNNVDADRAWAMGSNNTINSGADIVYNGSLYSGLAIGSNNLINAKGGIAFGAHLIVQSPGLILGTYNIPAGSDDWIQTDPLFTIANGNPKAADPELARSNALTLLKNGNLGIGVDDPLSTLDLANGGLNLGYNGKMYLAGHWPVGMIDTNWSIGKETPPAGAMSVTSEAVVFQAYHHSDNTQGWMFRNSINQSVFELSAYSKNAYFAGNVGIGTINPSTPMHIYSNSGSGTGLTIENTSGVAGANPYVLLRNNNPAQDAGMYNYLGNLSFRSNSGWTILKSSSDVNVLVVNGLNIGIGKDNPQYKLDVNGSIASNGVYIYGVGCVVGVCVSDSRLKKDIKPIENALEKIAKIQPSTFKFKDAKNGPTDVDVYGFIAQDVEKVFPEWVQTGEDGYKRVMYGPNVDMTLFEAVRELNVKVDNLAKENAELKKLLHEK